MSELPYTRGSREQAQEATSDWTARKNEGDLKRTIRSLVDAESRPQEYAANGERLEVSLHKKAQDLLPKDTADKVAAVNDLVSAERDRRAAGVGSER